VGPRAGLDAIAKEKKLFSLWGRMKLLVAMGRKSWRGERKYWRGPHSNFLYTFIGIMMRTVNNTCASPKVAISSSRFVFVFI
jgi:hypothetical protein